MVDFSSNNYVPAEILLGAEILGLGSVTSCLGVSLLMTRGWAAR